MSRAPAGPVRSSSISPRTSSSPPASMSARRTSRTRPIGRRRSRTPRACARRSNCSPRPASPIIYSGGGVINSGTAASKLLRELVDLTGFPITSTLMGLGAYPASGKSWLGMLGMHGTYEANWAMHDCDVMLCVGARFDDRITGKIDAFSPRSRKIHIDIDPSSDQQERQGRHSRHRRCRADAGGADPRLAADRAPISTRRR